MRPLSIPILEIIYFVISLYLLLNDTGEEKYHFSKKVPTAFLDLYIFPLCLTGSQQWAL